MFGKDPGTRQVSTDPRVPHRIPRSVGLYPGTHRGAAVYLWEGKGGCGSMDGRGNSPPAAQALTVQAQNQVGSHCGEKIAGYKGRSLVRETCKVQAEPTG